jgi:hypothetical protein
MADIENDHAKLSRRDVFGLAARVVRRDKTGVE